MAGASTHIPIPDWISAWFEKIELVAFSALAAGPSTVALFSTSMIVGICEAGPQSPKRFGALREPVRALVERAHECGVRVVSTISSG
jgi:hypothetical protein